MNNPLRLTTNKLDSVGYDTIYLESPMSHLVDFEWKNILDPPPKNTSKTTTEELKLIAKSTTNISKKDTQLVYYIDQNLELIFIPLLNKYKIKYPKNYIDLFYDIVHPILLNTKKYWNRARPKQLAKLYNIDINIIETDTHHTASYPSGHTVYSNLVALLLKNIYPQIEQKELYDIVLQTARARVIQGVHYPTDNKASLVFSKYVFDKLNPKLMRYYNDKI